MCACVCASKLLCARFYCYSAHNVTTLSRHNSVIPFYLVRNGFCHQFLLLPLVFISSFVSDANALFLLHISRLKQHEGKTLFRFFRALLLLFQFCERAFAVKPQLPRGSKVLLFLGHSFWYAVLPKYNEIDNKHFYCVQEFRS